MAWLSLRPTRGALHPTSLAEALLHQHRARLATAASKQRNQNFQIPLRAARARFAPWRTGHQPTEHARAGGLGVVVCTANVQCGARSTPRRWPRLFFNDTAPGQRPQLLNAATLASDFFAARVARASPRGTPAIHPRSTRVLADLAWLSPLPTWGAAAIWVFRSLPRSHVHPTTGHPGPGSEQ